MTIILSFWQSKQKIINSIQTNVKLIIREVNKNQCLSNALLTANRNKQNYSIMLLSIMSRFYLRKNRSCISVLNENPSVNDMRISSCYVQNEGRTNVTTNI